MGKKGLPLKYPHHNEGVPNHPVINRDPASPYTGMGRAEEGTRSPNNTKSSVG